MIPTIGSTTTQPVQRWCGQGQPHGTHIWVTEYHTYANCGGHS